MNKARRQELKKAILKLQEAADIIRDVKDDEDFAYNNLPEGLQCSMNGEAMEENVEQMEEIIDAIEESINVLEEIIYK